MSQTVLLMKQTEAGTVSGRLCNPKSFRSNEAVSEADCVSLRRKPPLFPVAFLIGEVTLHC